MTAFLHGQAATGDPIVGANHADEWIGGQPSEAVDCSVPGVAPDLRSLLHWAEENHEASAGATSASTRTKDDVEDALQPAASPAPKPIVRKKGMPVRADRAPSVDDILDPHRPSLDGASHDLVLQSIERLVNDIYDKVLYDSLNLLQVSLAKTAPPPATPFALTLLGWVVETIATWTIGSIGKIAAKEILGTAPTIGATDVTKSLATGAGKELKRQVTTPRPTAAPEPDDVPHRAAPGETLLTEFITRQKDKLLEKKNDAITTLALIGARARATAPADFIDLDAKLRALIGGPDLRGWFHHKVTMEWMNFLARVSLGPRESGQTTDMPGANSAEGVPLAAHREWAHSEGFVEITFTTPHMVHGISGLALQSASIPSSYGSMLKLHDADADIDGSGKSYTLATLPVYRRIWLQTGSSKLTTSPAFVITPEGHVEVDLGNPVLAAIGTGAPIEVGEVGYFGSAHPSTSSRATVAAYLIRDMLRDIKPGVLK